MNNDIGRETFLDLVKRKNIFGLDAEKITEDGGYLILKVVSIDVSSSLRRLFVRLHLAKSKMIEYDFEAELLKILKDARGMYGQLVWKDKSKETTKNE